MQTTRIAVFFHCIISGGSIPVDTEFACSVIQEQMAAHKQSGLLDAAEEVYIGVNGGLEDVGVVRMFVPSTKAIFLAHGPKATTEIPTLSFLRAWLPGHEGWRVIYTHTKSVTHPGENFYTVWRQRMTKAVIWGWRDCVADLSNGTDACGCHWLTPQEFPKLVKSPFFGGTFWWAKADYLKTLPQLPAATWANRFEAESWIGRGNPKPRVKDYYPGWP